MERFLYFVLLFTTVNCYSQDTIYWSPCAQLKFEDFQGTLDTTKIDLANSYIRINYTYEVVNDQLQFNVNCFFLKKPSWTKYNMPALTEHEQYHFDIAKPFALKLKQRFKSYQVTNRVQQDLASLYDLTIRELYAMADLLDERTKGAKNDIPEKVFMAPIKKQLPGCKKG
jgi:hypothetical protein